MVKPYTKEKWVDTKEMVKVLKLIIKNIKEVYKQAKWSSQIIGNTKFIKNARRKSSDNCGITEIVHAKNINGNDISIRISECIGPRIKVTIIVVKTKSKEYSLKSDENFSISQHPCQMEIIKITNAIKEWITEELWKIN